ncbi:replication initiator [Streptomyces eurocidicus]|uniref:Uncharacterized protein n=1 Tax=Streptomyces eurocidicus TaxID=66423 RepID=A0A7W8BCJ7_STREU|nr:replication initiator [Streptomyces eurocidicus]MBB5119786.1 hypothetical protein [Streptomyces eurocidicus]
MSLRYGGSTPRLGYSTGGRERGRHGVADTTAGTDHPIKTRAEIEATPTTPHVRTLMRTCWNLGGLPEYTPLRLRPWTHTLGYRGHILTKSRTYSTTYTALRTQRTEHQLGMAVTVHPDTATTDAYWRYSGSGHTPGAALIATGTAEDLARNREIAREARFYARGEPV